MLCLLHHADAVDAVLDPQRPLSRRGHEHAERIAERAQARGLRPDAIWHSGKLRTRQTAEPLWRRCNPLAEFSAVRALQPDDPPGWIRDTVDGDPRLIVLAGHMPHLARLYRLMTGEYPGALDFPLHGLVALVREDRGWVELWREV